jgi:hypothetical protein
MSMADEQLESRAIDIIKNGDVETMRDHCGPYTWQCAAEFGSTIILPE